jgi:hypothetical protein
MGLGRITANEFSPRRKGKQPRYGEFLGVLGESNWDFQDKKAGTVQCRLFFAPIS